MDKKASRIRRATRARRKIAELGATRLVVHLLVTCTLRLLRERL